MVAYYNEYDPQAAAWLRNLIASGHIAPGVVDERSIVDVRPEELKGFTQCHFFAGIGGWSYALHLAGWPDDKPVWTGSCPCQSFSTAGKQAGVNDPRHLWPVWFKLIAACKPQFIFGEQVAAAINHGWLDLIQTDLAGENYSSGGAVLGAHSVGAPHIRQRLYFGAHRVVESESAGEWRITGNINAEAERQGRTDLHKSGCPSEVFSRMADTNDTRPQRWTRVPSADKRTIGAGSLASGLADTVNTRVCGESRGDDSPEGSVGHRPHMHNPSAGRDNDTPNAPDGFWRAADWLWCRDGKWRPVESGTFPLANGVSERVGLLRGYGNAIVPQVAAEVIRAYMYDN